MAGERVRHNVTKDPVTQALENCAWVFLGIQSVFVIMLYTRGYAWLSYTIWALFGVLILDWAIILFYNYRLGQIQKFRNERLGYQEEQERLALIYPPGTDIPSDVLDVNDPATDPPAYEGLQDWLDTSGFRVIEEHVYVKEPDPLTDAWVDPLSKSGEDSDIGTDVDPTEQSGAGASSPASGWFDRQDGLDGRETEWSRRTGRRAGTPRHGSNGVPHDGTGPRLDVYAGGTTPREGVPVIEPVEFIVETIAPGSGKRTGFRRFAGRYTSVRKLVSTRDDADQAPESPAVLAKPNWPKWGGWPK